jgi:hypothetical protein
MQESIADRSSIRQTPLEQSQFSISVVGRELLPPPPSYLSLPTHGYLNQLPTGSGAKSPIPKWHAYPRHKEPVTGAENVSRNVPNGRL